jgi:hypothetical protein
MTARTTYYDDAPLTSSSFMKVGGTGLVHSRAADAFSFFYFFAFFPFPFSIGSAFRFRDVDPAPHAQEGRPCLISAYRDDLVSVAGLGTVRLPSCFSFIDKCDHNYDVSTVEVVMTPYC